MAIPDAPVHTWFSATRAFVHARRGGPGPALRPVRLSARACPGTAASADGIGRVLSSSPSG